jgi:hypothetical protein
MRKLFFIAPVALSGLLLAIFGPTLFLGGGKQSSRPAPSPTASARPSATSLPTPNPTERPTAPPYVPPPPPPTVRISGQGAANSEPFRLDNYIGWKAHYHLHRGCQYNAVLKSTDGAYNNTDFVNDAGPTSATKILRPLEPGTYYVAMATKAGCAWAMIFTPY